VRPNQSLQRAGRVWPAGHRERKDIL